jgi:hypothetical protein
MIFLNVLFRPDLLGNLRIRAPRAPCGQEESEMEFWLLEILRLGVAFGVTALIVWFWYWLMDSIGTF